MHLWGKRALLEKKRSTPGDNTHYEEGGRILACFVCKGKRKGGKAVGKGSSLWKKRQGRESFQHNRKGGGKKGSNCLSVGGEREEGGCQQSSHVTEKHYSRSKSKKKKVSRKITQKEGGEDFFLFSRGGKRLIRWDLGKKSLSHAISSGK